MKLVLTVFFIIISTASYALAQDAASAATAPAPGGMNFLTLFLMIFAAFYLIILAPSKRVKEQKALMGSLKKGDKVVTNSGMIAKVHSISEDEDTLKLEIANNTMVEFLKDQVSKKLEKKEKDGNK